MNSVMSCLCTVLHMEMSPADIPIWSSLDCRLVCLGDAHVTGHGSVFRHARFLGWQYRIIHSSKTDAECEMLQLDMMDLGGQVIK